jgi:hypothetical protein
VLITQNALEAAVLAFLDSLCGALIARDTNRIWLLLAHPLAQALPRGVREEATAIANGHRRSFVAPIQTLQFYHQTAHLLGVSADPATPRDTPSARDDERRQFELPLERATTH